MNLYKTNALQSFKNVAANNRFGRFFVSIKKFIGELLPIAPTKRLLTQGVIISLVAIIATSFTPGATFTAASLTYSYDYISEYYLGGDVLVDEDGYLVKINPQTDHSSRIGLTDYAVHTVESGETLSVIAQTYGVGADTIIWENKLANANSLRVGQKLLVPPVDGISYSIQSGDSLEKLAEKYKISVDAIIAQNNLGTDTLVKGQDIFLPGAVPLQPVVTAYDRNATVTRSASRSYADVSASNSIPLGDRPFIYPTLGDITQGYRAGHYAIDIGNRSMPPIWAAGEGTVVKASSGTWGGGYGNHVIIDHGNGLQTLYAHMDSLNVEAGDYVSQGDVIGIMGNTGRVYGVTGIHLHFEVIQDGVKQYPPNYY